MNKSILLLSILLLCKLTFSLTVPTEINQELTYPEERRSRNGLLKTDLRFSAFNYENPLAKITTRAYEESIPGPTLRLKRGDKLIVNLINELGDDNPNHLNMSDVHNTYSLPNTTNLHTHGLHVSGESPGDNVLVIVYPGETETYEIDIPEDHAGGTFWYHPHRHGSTFLQVSGLAAGMIIVEDDKEDNIPEEILSLKEVSCVIQHLRLLGTLSTQQIVESTIPYDDLWKQELIGYSVGENDYDYNMMLVNGLLSPKKTLYVGEWQRFRFLLAGHSQHLKLTTDLENCEMNLLTKDGIYIFDAPRPITYIYLSPGSRADVAIRCNKLGNYTIHSVGKTTSTSPFSEWIGTLMTLSVVFPSPSSPAFHYSNSSYPEDQILKTDIERAYNSKEKVLSKFASKNPNNKRDMKMENNKIQKETFNKKHFQPLNKFSVRRPHYLQDLTTLNSNEIAQNFTVIASVTNNQATINGELFEAPPYYLTEIEVGKVQEWTLMGISVHPIHIHINPFQIVGPLTASDDDYFKIGDYHDTLASPAQSSVAVVRFQTDIFTGHMVFHCHILAHEDLGMMAIANIVGEEGSRYQFPSQP